MAGDALRTTKPRPTRAAMSCDRCKSRKTKCNKPANGPCEYCRSINEVCSFDIGKRRQKPFYFVSEEEYRLLHQICKQCLPGEELSVSNLRRLAAELAKAAPQTRTPDSASQNVPSSASSQAKTPAPTPRDEEDSSLPELVDLHQDLGCLMADSQGEYRKSNDLIFNFTQQRNKEVIPSMIKASMPINESPLGPGTVLGESAEVPPRNVVLACLPRYFEQVSMYWLYTTEDFYKRLEVTYSDESNKQSNSWICALQSIVALCATGPPLLENVPNEQLGRKHLMNAKLLASAVCDEADLDSVRALVLLALALQSNGNLNSAYLYTGLAARVAFSLGLHQDKYSTKSGLVSETQARRVWWTLYLFDQDISLQLGKPCMNISSTSSLWQLPMPSEDVVNPGTYLPYGYLGQWVNLAQVIKKIRQTLYTGPIQEGLSLCQSSFEDAMRSLKEYMESLPPHLQITQSVPPPHRRSISLLHLRYWYTVILVTRPFLLCRLLRAKQITGTAKLSYFDKMAEICASSADSALGILERMVDEKVVSSLVLVDFVIASQVLQVILVSSALYSPTDRIAKTQSCMRILQIIGSHGCPRLMLPESMFQMQSSGIDNEISAGQDSAAINLSSCDIRYTPEAMFPYLHTHDIDSFDLPQTLNLWNGTADDEFMNQLLGISRSMAIDQPRDDLLDNFQQS